MKEGGRAAAPRDEGEGGAEVLGEPEGELGWEGLGGRGALPRRFPGPGGKDTSAGWGAALEGWGATSAGAGAVLGGLLA